MNFIFKYSWVFFVIFIPLFVFSPWFIHTQIIGGDWPYLYHDNLKEISWTVPSWLPQESNGFGGQVPTYAIDSYLYFIVSLLVKSFHFDWIITYKLFFFGLFIVLSITSILYLLKIIFYKTTIWQKSISVVIYLTNTYILMISSGGQLGVSLAYSMAPFVVGIWIKLLGQIYEKNIQNVVLIRQSILVGIIVAIQVLFDLRITFICFGILFIYFITIFFIKKYLPIQKLVVSIIISTGITFLLHFYWLFPLLYFKSNPLPTGFGSEASFAFLSFATFSQSFSLLHPNWPENIFGKIYFMRPEFLFLPILFYSSLFFITSQKKESKKISISVVSFILLGIVGAFLGKGAQEPFGQINTFFFQHIPGFNFFRDSTKWYLIEALTFSVIIPFTLENLSHLVSKKYNYNRYPILGVISSLFIVFWLFSLRPLFYGEVGKTFQVHTVPNGYQKLEKYINSRENFSRTLWIPMRQRFSFSSSNHPAVEAAPLFHTSNNNEIINHLSQNRSRQLLSDLSIQYVIIPEDSLGEIFLKNRTYDEKEYQKVVTSLEQIPWLKEIPGFDKVKVFENVSVKPHIALLSDKGAYKMIKSQTTKYEIQLKNIHKGDFLILNERYDSHWQLLSSESIITPKKIAIANSIDVNMFQLQREGTYTAEVLYTEENVYAISRGISMISFIMLGTIFLLTNRKRAK